MSEAHAVSTPRHLWIVGGFVLLWSLLGGLDFLLLVSRNEWYRSHFTPQQLAFGDSYPTWIVAAWAIAVWGTVVGAAFMLLRNDLAVPVLAVAFLSAVVMSLRNVAQATSGIDVGVIAVLGLMLVLILYAQRLVGRGVLA